jgi:hypothetical protein
VAVSQDGNVWHTFASGPWADDFAPTLGREYDPGDPYRPEDPANPGEVDPAWDWNQWWGDPTNPTVPVDPALSWGSFINDSVAEIAEAYRYTEYGMDETSAGGTAFDLDWLNVPGGLDWIQHIRVIDDPASGATTEIDAFADVAPVPEPATLVLLAVGAGAALARRRKRQQAA